MIRHLILSVCLVLVAFPAIKAAPIDGIRIEVHTVEWWYWSTDSRFACLLSVVL